MNYVCQIFNAFLNFCYWLTAFCIGFHVWKVWLLYMKQNNVFFHIWKITVAFNNTFLFTFEVGCTKIRIFELCLSKCKTIWILLWTEKYENLLKFEADWRMPVKNINIKNVQSKRSDIICKYFCWHHNVVSVKYFC